MSTIRKFAFACSLATLSLLAIERAATAQDDGFRPIFNGKDLTGWDGNPDFWRVEDSAITGQTTAEKPTKGNTFIIWRQGESVDDFELKLEYKIVNGNSGVQYRSFEAGEKWVVGGYQADIDSTDRYTGILYSERERQILCERGQKTTVGEDHKPKVTGSLGDAKELQAKIKKEDWNEYHLIAQGNHFTHRINGVTMAEVVDEDRPTFEAGKPGRRANGILALQLHAGPSMKVQFRNIRLRRTPLAGAKKVVFVAGNPSHGFGAHDHKSGCNLLKNHLEQSGVGIVGTVYFPGWPKDPTAFDNANAVVVYSDGGGGHPIVQHVDEMMALARKGLGLGFIHYAVEVEKGKVGDAFLDWTGGYFEMNWSVNPHWTIRDPVLAKNHPVTRGVRPYSVNDEWYFHMRMRDEGVTPILSAVAPPETMSRPDGTHSGNPAVRESVRKGELQHLVWARQRPDGGRGFGFTGGHVHWNWGHPMHRRLALNAIAWIAGVEVPPGGVADAEVTVEELLTNHDEPIPPNFDPEPIRKEISKWVADFK
jgi:hypothetical protein